MICWCGCGIEVDVARLRTDPAYMVEFYWNLPLAPKQERFLRSCMEKPHTVFLSCRGGGKTWAQGFNIFRRLVFGKQVNFVFYAPTIKQALGVVFARVKELFQTARHDLMIDEEVDIREVGKIFMGNGNKLVVHTAAKDSNVRGEHPTDIGIDESQSITDSMYRQDIRPQSANIQNLTADDFRAMAESGIDMSDSRARSEFLISQGGITTRIYESGTPLGRNHFWESCMGEGGSNVVIQPLDEAWFTNMDQVERDREELSEREFDAEYNCIFHSDAAYAFPQEKVKEACAHPQPEDGRAMERTPGAVYVAGIDLGQRQDYSVMAVLECVGAVRRLVMLNQWDLNRPWDEMIEEMHDIVMAWQPEMVFVDKTGPQGIRVFSGYLVQLGWKGLLGYTFTSKTVGAMMEELRILFERDNLELWDDRVLKQQFMDIEERRTALGVPTYPKPAGGKGHDDMVYAIGLGVMAALLRYGRHDGRTQKVLTEATGSDKGHMVGSGRLPRRAAPVPKLFQQQAHVSRLGSSMDGMRGKRGVRRRKQPY